MGHYTRREDLNYLRKRGEQIVYTSIDEYKKSGIPVPEAVIEAAALQLSEIINYFENKSTQNEQLSGMAKLSGGSFSQIDKKLKFTSLSPETASLLGITSNPGEKVYIQPFLVPESAAALPGFFRALEDSGAKASITLHLLMKGEVDVLEAEAVYLPIKGEFLLFIKTPNPRIFNPSLLDKMAEGYIELDNNLCYTYVNSRIGEMTMRKPASLLGKFIWDEFPDAVGSATFKAIEKALRTQEYVFSEDYFPLTDLWQETHIYPFQRGLSIFIVDITARKKAELLLAETCSIGQLGTWEINYNSNLLQISAGAGEILGYDGLASMSVAEVFQLLTGKKQKRKTLRAVIEAANKKLYFDELVKIETSLGISKWIRCRGRAEYVAEKPVRLWGIMQDITYVKNTQEASQENEALLQAFLDNGPASCITDENGNYIFANKEYYLFTKLPVKIEGKNVRDVFPRQNAEDYLRHITEVATSKKPVRKVSLGLRPDGSTGKFMVLRFPVDTGNSVTKIGSIGYDITDQINITNNIAERERFIKNIADNVPCMLAYWTNNGICSFVNNQFSQWQRKRPGDIIGRTLNEVFGPELYAFLQPHVKKVLQGRSVQFELPESFSIAGNKTPQHLLVQYVPDVESLQVRGYFSLITDITPLKMALLAVETEEQNKEALINSSKDFIWSVDKDMRLITANSHFKDWMGSLNGTVVAKGKKVPAGFGFDDELVQQWEGYFSRALKGETFKIETFTAHEGTGREIWIENVFNPIIEHDQVTGVACLSRDITQGKKDSEVIRNNEERLRSLLYNIADIIILLNENGTITYQTPSVSNFLGYEEEGLTGKTLFDIVYPDDLSFVNTILNKTRLEGGISDLVECKLKHRDGRYIYVEIRGNNQLHNPAIKGFVITTREITARKEREIEKNQLVSTLQLEIEEKTFYAQALEESDKKYRYLFQNSPAPMLIWDFKTLDIVDCNDEVIRKYGYSRQDFLRLNMRQIRPNEDVALFEAATHTESVFNSVPTRVWGHIKKSGEIMVVEVTGKIFDLDGRRVSIIHINEITEKVKAEKALLESEERYKLLFYKSPLPKCIYDISTMEVLDANEAAVKKYGYLPEEFNHTRIDAIIPPDEKDELSRLQQKIKTKDDDNKLGMFNLVNNKGQRFKAEIFGHRFNYKQRNCMLLITVDVTERLNYIASIELQNGKLREIAWLQSHVVRMPLSRMMGIINLIKDDSVNDAEKKELINYVLETAEELDLTIKEIAEKTFAGIVQ